MRRIFALALLPFTLPAAERLTLEQAKDLALKSHPRLAARQHEAAAAHQRPAQERARLLPQFTVSSAGALAEDNNTRLMAGAFGNPTILNRWGNGISLNQMVTDFGRTRALAQSAQQRAESAGQAVRVTRANLLVQVARAYYAALGAQAVRKVTSETVRVRETVAGRAKALADNKLRSELDVTFANVDLAEARLLENNAVNAERAAMVDLAASMGLIDPPDFDLVEEPLPEPLPTGWADAARDASANRPEIRQAKLEESAAASFTEAERLLRRPVVNALLSTGVTPFHSGRLQNHWNAGMFTVDFPVFNGGLFTARRREAEARQQAAAATVKDIANQVNRDVRLAHIDAVNAYERLQLTAVLVEQARKSFDLAKARYDLGLGTIVEMSQAQLAMTRAEIAQVTARLQYQSSRVVLDYQKGAL